MADEQDEAPHSPDIHFEPIIKLPLVSIKTLEENEEVLFSMRAKLYRYDYKNSEWKERGTGEVKLLKQKDCNSVRVLMRRDKTLKICANHNIQPYMELKPNNTSDRAWIWTTLADFADEELKQEMFAIRFANVDNAQKFKAAFNSALELVSNERSTNLSSSTDDDDNDEEDDKHDDETKHDDEKEAKHDEEKNASGDSAKLTETSDDTTKVTEKLGELSVSTDDKSNGVTSTPDSEATVVK